MYIHMLYVQAIPSMAAVGMSTFIASLHDQVEEDLMEDEADYVKDKSQSTDS